MNPSLRRLVLSVMALVVALLGLSTTGLRAGGSACDTGCSTKCDAELEEFCEEHCPNAPYVCDPASEKCNLEGLYEEGCKPLT